MITMDKDVTWMKPTHLLSFFSLNPRATFCTSTFTSTLLIAFFIIRNLRKIRESPLCILCALMPQIINPFTLMLVHTWYEESNPPCSNSNIKHQQKLDLPWFSCDYYKCTLFIDSLVEYIGHLPKLCSLLMSVECLMHI